MARWRFRGRRKYAGDFGVWYPGELGGRAIAETLLATILRVWKSFVSFPKRMVNRQSITIISSKGNHYVKEGDDAGTFGLVELPTKYGQLSVTTPTNENDDAIASRLI